MPRKWKTMKVCALFLLAGIAAAAQTAPVVVKSPDGALEISIATVQGRSVSTGGGQLAYQVTFRGFSPEIARVLEAVSESPHGMIVRTMSVQPAGADTGAPPPMPSRGGLQTVLNEQMLRVTMVIEVVKLTPKN